MGKKIRDILIGIFIGILISASLYIIPQAFSSDWGMGLPFTSQQLAIIKKVKIALETYQIDGDKAGKIDNDKMYYGALKGLVASVGDPFTRFVDPKALEDEQVEIEGEYGGLGIYITTKDGHTTVIAPIENTPADKVGVKPLDEIIKVDEKSVYGLPSDDVVKLLRGPANTEVKIWVRRKGKDALIPFTIIREIIKIKSVRTEMIDDIAYVKINQFNMKTDREMAEAIKLANSKKAKGILLDLRNNPGGLLDTCINVASQFQDGGPVVGMRGRFDKANETIYADKGKSTKLPLVVLVNEGSASASEILAGTIKDNKRGTIVGTKTFGKGSVQTLFNLPDKSGVYITIARYHTPSGFVIDQKGLEPDIKIEGEPKKNKKEDAQLQKALSVLKTKVTGK